MTTQVIDMCSDPLCGNVACYTMISRVQGHRTKMCKRHHDQVIAAASKAKLDVSKLDVRPIRGNCGNCLMEDANVVALQSDGVCPVCGVNYSDV